MLAFSSQVLLALFAFCFSAYHSFLVQPRTHYNLISSQSKSPTFRPLHAVNPWGNLGSWFGANNADSKSVPAIEEAEVVVVGSGISGSTAAFYMNKRGLNVILTEARDVVGGNLISKTENGFLWEEGPNSFQPNPAILRFAKDLGLMDELVLADPTLPRFVFWEGQLYALPGGLGDLPTFNLLSWPGKIRAGLGALGLISPRPAEEESVEQFVTRHLGEETFKKIIDPFVSGVYAGDPQKLSMKAALKKVYALEDLGFNSGFLSGAIVRINQLAAERKKNEARDADLPKIPGGSLGTFKRGLQSLPLKVQEILGNKLRLEHKLTNVARGADGKGWVCTFETPKGSKQIKCQSLVMTSPSYVTASIIGGESGVLPVAKELENIYYPPVASVTLAYPNEAFKKSLVGFGHLIPRAMKVRTLGTIWSSSLFPGRVPEGYTMVLNYIGGARDAQIVDLSSEQIITQCHEDVKKILLKEDAPLPKVLGCRLWQQAIPQYQKGHLDILSRLDTALKSTPGLFVGGNFKNGVAFGDCVQYGADVAKDVVGYIKSVSDNAKDSVVSQEAISV